MCNTQTLNSFIDGRVLTPCHPNICCLILDNFIYDVMCISQKNFINFHGDLPLAFQSYTDWRHPLREWHEIEITEQIKLSLNKDDTRIMSAVGVLMWINYSEFWKGKAPCISQHPEAAPGKWRQGVRQPHTAPCSGSRLHPKAPSLFFHS